MTKPATNADQTLYTYRAGKKHRLVKRPDQFVVRRLAPDLPPKMAAGEQVSTLSTRVRCSADKLDAMMDEARTLAPTHHAYDSVDSGTQFLITDRIIVTFNDDLSPVEVGEFAGRYALEIVERITARSFLFRLSSATGMNPIKLVVKLTEEDNEVETVDHDLNMVFEKSQFVVPDDQGYNRQWHLHRHLPEQEDYDHRASARCEAAWDLLDSFGQRDVVVGVADDGCQLDHPDFDSADKFAGWGYFATTASGRHSLSLTRMGDPGADPSQMYIPGANHGTACAGVIGAEVDGLMTVGAAPDVRLLPIRWPSNGPSLFIGDTRLRRALSYMANRVDVMSNSWGSSPLTQWSATTLEMIDQLAASGGRRGKGIVFLWAAGNDNCPIAHEADQPVPFTTGVEVRNGHLVWVGVQTSRVFSDDLAGRDGVLQIAALASTAQRSHYSNYGPGIDLCAPSSNSHTYYRMRLDGRGITTAKGQDAVRDDFGGTSSATPLTAGIAALVISANPELSAAEVIAILKRTASKDLNMEGYPRTPPLSGIDTDTSWDVSPIAPFDSGGFSDQGHEHGTWSPWFGHGRVDALDAVKAALGTGQGAVTQVAVAQRPNLAIPDRDAVGVTTGINVTERGAISALSVNVDITHTWIGDLTVELLSPTGRRIPLHSRAGNNADNIVRTYDADSTPSLAQLEGEEIHGPWLLRVADHVSADTGRLNGWGISAEINAKAQLQLESAPGAVIPDNSVAGISDVINVDDNRNITSLSVEVDITHRWRGDLVVSLTGPSGLKAVLHNRGGADADNLQAVFSTEETNALARFKGQSAAGDWTLTVSDRDAFVEGKLARWALVIS